MLKSVNRLTKKKDFDHVFKQGKSSIGSLAVVKVIKNDIVPSRFGIIVSAKVSKKAVVRNRVKRQVRAILKKALPVFKAGQDLIIIVRPAAANEKYLKLEKDFDNHFRKLRLYKTGHNLG
ncbi:MAG: ribonuclease P protein component [Planctomycetes bacterium]|jgi:ribonuclease P protein component|nr:ribonuclease P protein component [Planctomycetota bacterium]